MKINHAIFGARFLNTQLSEFVKLKMEKMKRRYAGLVAPPTQQVLKLRVYSRYNQTPLLKTELPVLQESQSEI